MDGLYIKPWKSEKLKRNQGWWEKVSKTDFVTKSIIYFIIIFLFNNIFIQNTFFTLLDLIMQLSKIVKCDIILW